MNELILFSTAPCAFGTVLAAQSGRGLCALLLGDDPWAGLDLPLDLRGSAFQITVWKALQEIPPGRTETYGAVAQRIGAPALAKEVGEACAANSLAVAIPCHRVIRKDGGLSGYRWGVPRKRALLALEKR
jgi:AraC family transcriptional regulator, regulatory protein of adaptative response / methylated-DNA-[protein]-cysteine methyltransferase